MMLMRRHREEEEAGQELSMCDFPSPTWDIERDR